MSCAFWVWLLLGSAACNELGALHSHPHGRFGRYRYFTVEVLTWLGLTTYYILFFLHLETRRVTIGGITQHPAEEWMVQMARNAVDVIDGTLLPVRYALHDRDTKFCSSFRTMVQSGGIQQILLPPRSPNLNAFAEPWVRFINHECLSKLVLFGEA